MFHKVVVAGFAIFAMLFGSGNIVFPFIIGKNFASDWMLADLGWLLAAALIPMVGYFGAMLFDASAEKYMKPLGRYVTAAFMCLVMLMVGPFGVSARCVNVSFGGLHIACPETSELAFNSIFCAVSTLLAWNPGRIVQLMGAVFTPLKFFGIAVVVLGALYLFNGSIPLSMVSKSAAFSGGFEMGYQTMDLLAAFIFTAPTFAYLKNSLPEGQRENKRLLLSFCLKACVIGGLLLAIVYTGLALVGAEYSNALQGTADEALFAKIAEVALGSAASLFVAIVTAASCLATNIALTSVFTDYVHKSILKERGNRSAVLVAVGAATLCMSLLGFSKICSLLAVVLEKLYPALILFVVARIAWYYIKQPENV